LRVFAFLAAFASAGAAAQEIVTLQTRPGVTQSFVILDMAGGGRGAEEALSVAAGLLGRDLGDEVAGVVLTSTMFGSSNPRRQAPTLRGFDYARIKAPLLFVHHRDDACEHTPYASAARLSPQYALVTVKGGKPAESGSCEPLSAHGYYGKEARTVDAIAAWMLKKSFSKEIE
jgi:pimeloyl-ACP methyl ester carboxylesterase